MQRPASKTIQTGINLTHETVPVHGKYPAEPLNRYIAGQAKFKNKKLNLLKTQHQIC